MFNFLFLPLAFNAAIIVLQIQYWQCNVLTRSFKTIINGSPHDTATDYLNSKI